MNIITGITAGVDWLSATLPKSAKRWTNLVRNGHDALLSIKADGYEMAPRSMLGYAGMGCGNCFVGMREDDVMVQFTGHHADRFYAYMMLQRPDVARIDIQTSVQYETMPLNIAKDAFRDGNEVALKMPKHMRRKLLLMTGTDGGDTCYVGSSSAEQRSRIYNKEIQSEDPKYTRTWRWEVVFKNEAADEIVNVLRGPQEDIREKCAEIVAAWHIKRGITPDWSQYVRGTVLPIVRTLPTDVQRKLQWLEHQVKPTIRVLQELGYNDSIWLALGIVPPAPKLSGPGDG